MAEKVAGDVYAGLVKDTLVDAREVEASLIRRGQLVVTTSATLATLLFGLVAVITDAEAFELPGVARPFLGVATLFFVGSALLAIALAIPREHKAVALADLRRLTESNDEWNKSERVGLRAVAKNMLGTTEGVRYVNRAKAKQLKWAIRLQVWAVASLAVGTLVILFA